MAKRIVIIGGVAGGASAAARLRRLSEESEITIIERGNYVSFANCGLPYHIGGEIPERSKLLLHTAQSLEQRYNLRVRTNTTAEKILSKDKKVQVRTDSGVTEDLPYDELILATGAAPLLPKVPGVEGKGVYTLRDIADMDAIIEGIENASVENVVVVGGGFIGVEVAEQLVGKVKNLTLVAGSDHVVPPLDVEMARPLNQEIQSHLQLELDSRLASIERDTQGNVTGVGLSNDKLLKADLVILGIGVRPENQLAKDSGLTIGKLGGIQVNEYLQTSADNIWAIGDAIEVQHFVSKQPALIALAGPANRQGRLVADNIILEKKKPYAGTLGTAIIRVFSKVAACTGLNEESLKKLNLPYETLYLFPASHAGYFPGAKTLAMKILFNPDSRQLLGAQVVGEDGVDKRIDVFATAIKGGLSIDEIADLELSYAPPFGSAKDPINMAGMAAQNVAENLVRVVTPKQIDGFILDVRSPQEFEKGAIPGAVNIPLDELRDRFSELPKDEDIFVYCLSGQRSYNATRILLQSGFAAVNVTGAYRAYSLMTGR